jgi:integrase
MPEYSSTPQRRRNLGCMQRNNRNKGPDVWQFRWSETRLDGKRFYHKKIVGTVEQYPDEDAARRSRRQLG